MRPRYDEETGDYDMFQSTHSLRSATATGRESVIVSASFNPRTPCGVRQVKRVPAHIRSMFQSTHSLRSATSQFAMIANFFRVSIHALLAECDMKVQAKIITENVSIHALLAECDWERMGTGTWTRSFNPRTPCGVRQQADILERRLAWFQSTHSLRSATPG